MTTTIWDTDRRDKADRLSNASRHADGKIVPTGTSDRESQKAAEKKVRTRRGKAISEE